MMKGSPMASPVCLEKIPEFLITFQIFARVRRGYTKRHDQALALPRNISQLMVVSRDSRAGIPPPSDSPPSVPPMLEFSVSKNASE